MYFNRGKYNHQTDAFGGKRWSDRKRANPYGFPHAVTLIKRIGVWMHLVAISEIIAKLSFFARSGSYTWIAPPCNS